MFRTINILIILMTLVSCNNPYSRSTDYYETVAGHIVQILFFFDGRQLADNFLDYILN